MLHRLLIDDLFGYQTFSSRFPFLCGCLTHRVCPKEYIQEGKNLAQTNLLDSEAPFTEEAALNMLYIVMLKPTIFAMITRNTGRWKNINSRFPSAWMKHWSHPIFGLKSESTGRLI